MAVRNTAVPGTRRGASPNNETRNDSSGTVDARSRVNRISRPRRQVIITMNTAAPIASGNQPPSATFNSVAEKKAMSTTRKKPVAAMQSASG
ncbi:hypothetical protein D3C83_60790 [compost metagenome]